MVSHGFGGHRRQSTHFCTHLDSHGYVVAAPDHLGNTTMETMAWALSGQAPADLMGYTRDMASRTADRMVVLIDTDHYHFCDNAEVVHDLMATLGVRIDVVPAGSTP